MTCDLPGSLCLSLPWVPPCPAWTPAKLWQHTGHARMCAEILKDVLKPVDQVWMTERFKIAAVARYRRLSGACDDQLPFGQHQKGGSPDAGVSCPGA